MIDKYDAIVIGAGHNGLVCSALLAKAGKNVLVLEANDQVGGAAITREFADGYSVSACAHLLYKMQPQVEKDLNLNINLASDNLSTIVLSEVGEHVTYCGNKVTGVNESDQKNFAEFFKRMTRFSDLLNTYLNKPPPRLGTKNKKDLFTLAMLGFDLRRMGKVEMREFLRLIGMNIYDELDERFESPLLKGGLSLDSVLGTHLGPRSPNTILTYLFRMAGKHGTLSTPKGGMGSVTKAMSDSAKAAGVEIITNAKVKKVIIEKGTATGVELNDGTIYNSEIVVSNADPKKTMLELVGARNVETRFTHRIDNIRMKGNAAKLHIALNKLPTIKGFSESDYSQRILIAPDENYVERAFNSAKYGESSPLPVLEITFPSIKDSSLAPSGCHVMSAVVQYAPYQQKSDWNEEARTNFKNDIFSVLKQHMPDIENCCLSSEILTPLDLEKEFHITGGHWHHGELTLDQFMFVRPVAGSAQYQMPIDGLYLCGAGSHPGGGISGASGRNAAQVILKREKR
ncbi:MAG: phytoene dehydrogenase-like protein [Woeseiaceae bacterium]|jgi:phytoene dehydrogenase-like protein|tara:strand:+ start:4792 stop:6333 length:1542 start_codon:yes stop_codon:yes gene_type:complete